MIKLNKKKTKALAVRGWLAGDIYWIPTIQTELHLLPNSIFTNISIRDNYSAKGNVFSINIFIWIVLIKIDYWWKLKERKYED